MFMRNTLSAYLAILLPAVLLTSGCEMMRSPEEDPLYLKMTEMDNRLTRIERLVNNEGLAALMNEMKTLEADTRALRSEVETLQHEMEQANGRQREIYLDVDQRLQSMEQTSSSSGSDLNVLEGGSLDPGQLPVPGGTDRANYQAAFELLKQGRYDQAELALQQFMITFPDSGLSDNAQYWLAETHYVSQDYEKSLPEFITVINEYPDSRKIPDALLKIGYCNYELQRWDAARQALTSVVRDYPETTAARLANQRLERMAGEGH
jgi:tol-pal system protein YbgF